MAPQLAWCPCIADRGMRPCTKKRWIRGRIPSGAYPGGHVASREGKRIGALPVTTQPQFAEQFSAKPQLDGAVLVHMGRAQDRLQQRLGAAYPATGSL